MRARYTLLKSNMSRSAKSASPKKGKGLTKSQLVSKVADKTGLSKSQVNDVLDSLQAVVGEEVKSGRSVTIPGLAKVSVQHKAATQARQSMAFGNPITIKARPARRVIRVRAVKALKEKV
jgi:DNA-binding protein HU-beta